ncbi:solute carrier family 43 member 3-like [Gouania willdenowi]|uniref:Solute carrier family 43 member 3-like n=1 Tax=Gouania willdenowi TaxID=441366 RepID=A0A8C5HEB4_GOUWI|nr:solute carrier family 43 member 3-like [Gouania willdenowi]
MELQRWLTLLSGLVEGLLFTGISFGWVSLVFVLRVEGYFRQPCFNSTTEEGMAPTECTEQDQQLSQVMTVACICNTLTRFPIGYILDRYGTTVTRLIAMLLFITGTLMITLSSPETSVLLYPALSCLMVSGAILYISNVQVGNLFYSYRSTIITIYSGTFDSSALVFLVVKLLYERGVSIRSSFLFLVVCSVFLFLRTIFLMPKTHIPHPLPEAFTYGFKCPTVNKRRDVENKSNKETLKNELVTQSQIQSKGQEVSFRSCVLSWLFLWHIVWVVIIVFCHVIFLSTVNPTLSRLAQNDQTLVSHYSNVFAFTQLCSVFFAPISGLIMDRHKRRPLAPGETKREAELSASILALVLTCLLCFFFYVCFTSTILPLQYLTFILQVACSSFFYGGHQAFVSIAFPMTHFGKISGIAMFVSGVVLLLQFPILRLIQHTLQGNQLLVNIGVVLASLLAFAHPVHVSIYCRNLASQRKCGQKEIKYSLGVGS